MERKEGHRTTQEVEKNGKKKKRKKQKRKNRTSDYT